jgi:hypothetical protein
MLTPFERGLIAHLVGDWLLQNDWMARNKANLKHPAAWAHGAVLGALLALALGWEAGVLLGAVHILVDTRVPLRWWQGALGQTTDGPKAVLVSVGVDQVLHIASMAAWVAIAYR